jgi:hypothetical protein
VEVEKSAGRDCAAPCICSSMATRSLTFLLQVSGAVTARALLDLEGIARRGFSLVTKRMIPYAVSQGDQVFLPSYAWIGWL